MLKLVALSLLLATISAQEHDADAILNDITSSTDIDSSAEEEWGAPAPAPAPAAAPGEAPIPAHKAGWKGLAKKTTGWWGKHAKASAPASDGKKHGAGWWGKHAKAPAAAPAKAPKIKPLPMPKIKMPPCRCPVGQEVDLQVEDGCSCKPIVHEPCPEGWYHGEVDLETGALPPCRPMLIAKPILKPMPCRCPVGQEVDLQVEDGCSCKPIVHEPCPKGWFHGEVDLETGALPPCRPIPRPILKPMPCRCPVGQEVDLQVEDGCSCKPIVREPCPKGWYHGEVDLETGALPPCRPIPKPIIKPPCRCPVGQEVDLQVEDGCSCKPIVREPCPEGWFHGEVDLETGALPPCRPMAILKPPCRCPVGQEVDLQAEGSCKCKPVVRAPCFCPMVMCPKCDEYEDEYDELEVQAIPCVCPSIKCKACKAKKAPEARLFG